ncbi:MAG: FtsX-like permease family protein [Erysipelotrichaceae bacterium]|nr:FtsX-like permease family protein [Erysipelotrichaceae bacterium]
MIRRYIQNEIKDNKLLSVSTVVFMAASSCLISLALVLMMSLFGSLDKLIDTAKTPDFLQMHMGEIDEKSLNDFASNHQEIEDWQLITFLNLENYEVFLGEENLLNNTQDNGLCIQSRNFDYLLDMNNKIVNPNIGEVYVPISYRQLYGLNVNDVMRIADYELTIKGFIRDSQMNSMMASSKRFLVNEEDYKNLLGKGSEEYLIEFRLKSDTDLDLFRTDYLNASLPSNGPAITKGLIKLMNALSDGLMIFMILLAGVAVLLISLLCISYITSLGVEKDRHEAGMLKAIGINNKEIRKIYMAKYILFSITGGLIGLLTSFVLAIPLGKSLKEMYGASNNNLLIFVISVLISFLIQFLIILFVRSVLKRNNKLTVLESLFFNRNKQETSDKRQTLLIGVVMTVCVMLILIPQNIYSSLASPDFVTYMGIGKAEIRIDIRQSEDIDFLTEQLLNRLKEDVNVNKYVTLKTVSLPAYTLENKKINLLLELGDHSSFPVSYTMGREPVSNDEIALSVLQAEDLGLNIEDELVIGDKTYCISGLYSDITNGGKTAKARSVSGIQDIKTMWTIVYVSLNEMADKTGWIESYQGNKVEVVDIGEYVNATYGLTIKQLSLAKMAASSVSIIIVLVIMSLYVRLLIEKNRSDISLQKALGFRNKALRKMYIKKSCSIPLFGIIAGLILANLFGEMICGLALQSLGARGFSFVISWIDVLLETMKILFTVFIAAYAGSGAIKDVKTMECCTGKE